MRRRGQSSALRRELLAADRTLLGYAELVSATLPSTERRAADTEAGLPVRCRGWEIGVHPLYGDLVLDPDGTVTRDTTRPTGDGPPSTPTR